MEKKRIGGRCNFVEDQNQIYQSEGNTNENLTQLLIKAVKILFRLISRYGKGNLISKTAELKLQFFKFSTSKKQLAVRICRDNSQWQLFLLDTRMSGS